MPWQEFTELSAHAAIKGSGFLLEEEVQQIGSGGITPTAAQAPGITQKYRSKQCHRNSERKMEFQEDLGREPSLELMMAHSYSLQRRAAALWGFQGFFGVFRASLGFAGVLWGSQGFTGSCPPGSKPVPIPAALRGQGRSWQCPHPNSGIKQPLETTTPISLLSPRVFSLPSEEQAAAEGW